jgi:hypothetical protein
VAKVGTSKAEGTISQQAVVHPWLAVDAHGNEQKTSALDGYEWLAEFKTQPIYPMGNDSSTFFLITKPTRCTNFSNLFCK